jgi:hypothetical protein
MSTPCRFAAEGILTIQQPPKPFPPVNFHARVTQTTSKRITPSAGVSVVTRPASQSTRDPSICTLAFSGSKHADKPNSTKRSVISASDPFRSVSTPFCLLDSAELARLNSLPSNVDLTRFFQENKFSRHANQKRDACRTKTSVSHHHSSVKAPPVAFSFIDPRPSLHVLAVLWVNLSYSWFLYL